VLDLNWFLGRIENWVGNMAGMGEKGTAYRTLVGRGKGLRYLEISKRGS
jgi:hypothetical protein